MKKKFVKKTYIRRVYEINMLEAQQKTRILNSRRVILQQSNNLTIKQIEKKTEV